MTAMKEVLKKALEQITPETDKILVIVNATLKKLNDELKKEKINATAVAGGSVSKSTFLKDDYDCDIFVKFDKKEYSGKNISLILAKAVKKTFPKVKKVHGSRDYYQAKNYLNYEIIPVINISTPEEAENITDCSPLHVKWVSKFPNIKKEIMLAKSFTKSAGAYGAESYKKGFSGHVIDILTINYKGFLPLLKASAKWKDKQVIDYNNAHKGKALFNLNKSKTQSALIVIDPIASDRNASAALNQEKLDLFKKHAKNFLKKPSIDFFVRKEATAETLKKKAGKNKLIMVEAAPKTGKEDVIGAKLMKAEECIAYSLGKQEFILVSHGWSWPGKGKALFWFILDSKPLSKNTAVNGPPENMKEHADHFRKKYKKTAVKKGKLTAIIERKYTLPEDFIKDLLTDDYLKDKARSFELKK